MWSRASRRLTSLSELRSFGSADQTTTAAVDFQVGRIRQALGLPPPAAGFLRPSPAGRGPELVPGVSIIGRVFLCDTVPDDLQATLTKINNASGSAHQPDQVG